MGLKALVIWFDSFCDEQMNIVKSHTPLLLSGGDKIDLLSISSA